ncbi:MAG TPA: hypothetical protein ACHBX0_02790 [Arsenophonus sp.]
MDNQLFLALGFQLFKWLASFSPWKALVAAHLWQQQSSASY